jgi:hypothetical protein
MIVVIVVAALILLALFMLLGKKSRDKRHETRRAEAREIRREAELGRAEADKTRAEADAQAAEARRQEALARERAHEARERHDEARERHLEAARKDPDADEDAAAEQWDREHAQPGVAGAAGTTDADSAPASGRDSRVEHYERTADSDTERERRFARDSDGQVLRDEEYEQPRNR